MGRYKGLFSVDCSIKNEIVGVDFFLLFLFSLAFYNLIYAFLDMNLFAYYRPLHMFPFPYKWLIGVGFYFYIKNQYSISKEIIFHKKEWYLIAPAIVYFLLRTYWFSIAVSENSFRNYSGCHCFRFFQNS